MSDLQAYTVCERRTTTQQWSAESSRPLSVAINLCFFLYNGFGVAISCCHYTGIVYQSEQLDIILGTNDK